MTPRPSGDPRERLVRPAGLGTRGGDGAPLDIRFLETPGELLLETLDSSPGLPRRRIGVTGIALLDGLEQLLHQLEQ